MSTNQLGSVDARNRHETQTEHDAQTGAEEKRPPTERPHGGENGSVNAERDHGEQLDRELGTIERRLAEEERRATGALKWAKERLDLAEARAAKAEERAERAERLVRRRAERIERAGQLREMLDRIAKAEERASEAEERARAAVQTAREPMPEVDPNDVLPVDLNEAGRDQLLEMGFSASQTADVLAYRERYDGFTSLDELEQVAGISHDFLAGLKDRIRV